MPAPLPPPATARVGVAQVCITPPLGCSLAGYFHDRKAASVRDDLYARAMVIEASGQRLALVSCDLIGFGTWMVAEIKQRIAAATGLPPEAVLVCATHTHTGPEPRAASVVPSEPGYVAELPGLIAEAVTRAAGSMFAATLRPGRAELEGYSHNRLFRLKDGSEVFGAAGREDEVVGVAGPIDPQMHTLGAVDEEGNLRGLLVNFALHPDVIGGGSGNFISADWPGEVARNITAVYGPEAVALFLQGTCGDINHCTHTPTNLPLGGPAKAVQLGRAVAGAAMTATERAEPMTDLPVATRLELLSIPYYTRDQALLDEVARLKATTNLGDFERYLVSATEDWPHDGQIASVPVQVMRLGDLAVVGLPAEVFVRIGQDIKSWSPAPFTMVVELANGLESYYVPTTDQAERGAYGAKPILSRWLCADAGRRMADAAGVMLQGMW
jgi:hypothetical protein